MAENQNGAAEQPAQVKLNTLTQFVRDLSFENILAQKGTGSNVQMDVTVGVNLEAKNRSADHQHEVILKLKVNAKNKPTDEALFILEMEYAGVFHIEGVPDDQMHPFLMIECPRMIFPFVRRIVSDVTRDGGFPPLNLENIDFIQMYRNEVARRQAEAAEKAPVPEHDA